MIKFPLVDKQDPRKYSPSNTDFKVLILPYLQAPKIKICVVNEIPCESYDFKTINLSKIRKTAAVNIDLQKVWKMNFGLSGQDQKQSPVTML